MRPTDSFITQSQFFIGGNNEESFQIATTLIVLALISACASSVKIQSDYDHSMDFSHYKTYGFYSPMGIENPNYSSIMGQMFRDAIDARATTRRRLLTTAGLPTPYGSVSGQLRLRTEPYRVTGKVILLSVQKAARSQPW